MPGLRRLLDPRPDPEGHARFRGAQGEHRLHLWDRLLRAPALLHEHLRVPFDPRPRADDRHGPQGGPPGADGVGGHRRWRCALDRRQPHPPLDAPQRRHPGGDVQQPDLRADEGPGVPDHRVRPEDQVDADRLGGLSHPPARGGAGRRSQLRGAVGRYPDGTPAGRPGADRLPSRLRLRGGPPELQHLQRWGPPGIHGPGCPRRPDAHPGARQADDLREEPQPRDPARRAPAGDRAGR